MVEEIEADRRTTYRRFNHDVNRFAHGLKTRGVQVVTRRHHARNCLEYLIASYALKN